MPAFLRRAVETVLGVILLVLPIPERFELDVEQFVDVAQWDVLVRTTFWRHVSRIFDGHLEHSLKAFMTHAMPTS